MGYFNTCCGTIFVLVFVLTVVVNRRFLPAELKPPLWREIVMLVAAVCYSALLIATLFLDSRGAGRKLLEVLGLW